MSAPMRSPCSADPPAATVLVPVYNAQAYLLEALRSISAQTVGDFEILVVDDGSTDGSSALLTEYGRTEPRLRVLGQAHAGVSAALNAGIADARGEYTVRMDADDVMLPRRVETQLAFLRAHPGLGFCASAMQMIDRQGRVFQTYLPRPRSEAELDAMLAQRLPIVYTHSTVTYRTAAVRALGGYDRRYEPCEDMELFGRLTQAGLRGLVLPELLMHVRVHGASISGFKLAHQVATQGYVSAAFYARREGHALDRPGYDLARRAAPLHQRLASAARLRSDVLQRQAFYCRAAGRVWQARARLLLAAACRPLPAMRTLLRMARAAPAGSAESPRPG